MAASEEAPFPEARRIRGPVPSFLAFRISSSQVGRVAGRASGSKGKIKHQRAVIGHFRCAWHVESGNIDALCNQQVIRIAVRFTVVGCARIGMADCRDQIGQAEISQGRKRGGTR